MNNLLSLIRSQISPIHFYLYALIVLPASSFLPIKIGSFAFAVLYLCYKITIKGATNKATKNLLIWLVVWITILLTAFLSSIAVTNYNEYHSRALFSYFGFLLSVFFMLIAVRSKTISLKELFKAIVYASFVYSVFKTLLIFSTVFGFINVRALQALIRDFIGSSVVSFWSEDAAIARISFGNDIIIPFVASFVLLFSDHKIFSYKFTYLYIIIAMVSTSLGFTRYIWILNAYILVGYIIIVKGNIKIASVSAFLFTCAYVLILNIDWLNEIINIRSQDSTSIDMKNQQAALLITEAQNHIVFGNGLGGYIQTFIRSPYQPYLYEVQWAALLMQLGVVGLLVLAIGLILIIPASALTLRAGAVKSKEALYLIILYGLWLVSGMTNPYLFIMTSSVSYVLFYLFFRVKPE
ncbi:hypothetical protein HCU66_26850 [Pseudomonas frederiksbergensis]|uniref:hypothetical protein n=1 Tax=Pseudomonas frederiksbergensis TaxID=104087 RepID=UPI00197F4737|nr:hypothetical protein [Pseudomonas frederiksbergensis]MBN3865808.1 hypothetical protein [Pseudomonas frederiksbergensis]